MRNPLIIIGAALAVVVALGAAYYFGTQAVRVPVEKDQASEPPPAPNTVASQPQPKSSGRFTVGEVVEFEHGSVRVYDYQDDVQANTGFGTTLEPGNKFAAIDVEGCNRDSEAPISVNVFEFSLAMPDNTRVQPTGLPAVEPDLHNPVNLQRGECVRGWMSFQVLQEATPAAIVFASSSGTTARWDI
jgi:hypothetical protein